MLKIYLRAGFRSLLRYRSFSLINLIGLSLGFSAIMVLAVMLYQYLTVNGQFSNKDRMYYVKLRNTDGSEYMQTPFPFLDKMLATCPDIEAGTHIQTWDEPWLKTADKELQEKTWFVDSDFLQVFSFPLEQGNARTALQNRYSVALSHEVAEKFFGNSANAIGKTLLMNDSIPMAVTAVLRPVPSNTSERPAILLPMAVLKANPDFAPNANWYNTFAENYLLLRPGADTARLNAQLRQIAQANFNPNIKAVPYVLPFDRYVQEESGNLVRVLVKGLIGTIFFILLIIVANLINLNAATLLSRQKEMAVRKMVGSRKIHLVVQFMLENAITVFASLLLAFLLFQTFLMPALNDILRDKFGSIALNVRHDYPLAGAFVMAAVLIIILAASFPALHFSSLRAVDAIKGYITGKRDRYITRNIFITLQFVLATTFIGVSLILHSQISHMKNAALGFDKENMLVIPVDLAYRDPNAAISRYDALLNDLRRTPAVAGFSTSWNIPTSYDDNFNIFIDPATGRELHMRQASIDDGMLPAYRIPLVEGRNFNGVNDSLDAHSVIINRRAAEMMGWTNAVGKQLRPKGDNTVLTVVGVTADYHYGDLTRNIDPVLHWYMGKQKLSGRYMSVRYQPGHRDAVVQMLTAAFKEMPSRRSFEYTLLDDRIQQQYALLDGILKATNYVAVLTIFIAAMGLFGLIALFTRQRVKEVGIRKVLGASTSDIVQLLSRNFLFLVGIALLIATPIAWYLMHRWLQDFAYRVDIEWWMLGGAGLIALGIALVTVGFHAIRAAMANPVESLRSE